MNFRLFFSALFTGIFFYTKYCYCQSTYKSYNGILYENNKELFRNDKFPFFVRGIYRLNTIVIEPKLTKNDSINIYKSMISENNTDCITILDYLYKVTPSNLITIDITEDSMKFVNLCYSPMLKSTFWHKKIKSYSEYINPIKLGYVSVEFSLSDSDGFHSKATFDFPELTLRFKGYIDGLDNKYLISGEFVMVKYRHFKDNSLREVKRP